MAGRALLAQTKVEKYPCCQLTNYPYSVAKLHDVILAVAVARKWTGCIRQCRESGLGDAQMGGAGAPDKLKKGYQTQGWLAASNDPEARVSGHYFHHKRHVRYLPAAKEIVVQEKFLTLCEQIAGVRFGNGQILAQNNL